MIRKIKETIVGKVAHEDGFLFWTYLICVISEPNVYDLIRINNRLDKMEVLGRELDINHCIALIAKAESCNVYLDCKGSSADT